MVAHRSQGRGDVPHHAGHAGKCRAVRRQRDQAGNVGKGAGRGVAGVQAENWLV